MGGRSLKLTLPSEKNKRAAKCGVDHADFKRVRYFHEVWTDRGGGKTITETTGDGKKGLWKQFRSKMKKVVGRKVT